MWPTEERGRGSASGTERCYRRLKRLTDPRSLTRLLGVVQLVAKPGEDAVRVPERLVVIVKPDCGEEDGIRSVLDRSQLARS